MYDKSGKGGRPELMYVPGGLHPLYEGKQTLSPETFLPSGPQPYDESTPMVVAELWTQLFLQEPADLH